MQKHVLTLEQTQKVLNAALAKATEMGVPQCVAIVDDGGHLLAFARQDGTRILNVGLSQQKAYTAIAVRTQTDRMFVNSGQNLPSFIAMSTIPGLTLWHGGMPLKIGKDLVGAIGVSGGTPDDDVQVCNAGREALES